MAHESIQDQEEASPKLLIVGASARAAAESAMATHFQLVAADLFADRDLISICDAIRLEPNYRGLAEWIERVSPDYWMYTGALENYRMLVEATAARVPLLGNSSEVLKRVRDPRCLRAVVQQVDWQFPQTILGAEAQPAKGRWLFKPHRSAAGIGITWSSADARLPDGYYRQRYEEGCPCSAVFLAQETGTELLGVTRQLVGDSGFGASQFQYCGSIGPWELVGSLRQKWCDLGVCLTRELGLIGLSGVDAILKDSSLTLIEINPRYTASVEILERALGRIAIPRHIQACLGRSIVPNSLASFRATAGHGKAIVYAPADVTITADFIEAVDRMNEPQQVVADLPHRDLQVAAGSPLVTVLASVTAAAELEEENKISLVYQLLRQRAEAITSLLDFPGANDVREM